MAFVPLTVLPEAPVRGDVPATFATKANAFVAALPTLRTEINNAGVHFDGVDTSVNANRIAAELAETNAETAETNTLLLSDSVIATANFKGNWSDLTGALNKPASVANHGLVWLLLNNLADVTLSEPTSSNTDWLIAVSPPTSASLSVAVGAKGVTAGNVVELVSDGVQNLQNIYHCEAPTISSLLTLDGTNNVKDLSLSALTSTTAFACWNDDTANLGQLAILTAGSPPTMSAVVATSTNDDIQFASSPLSATTVALSYNAGTNGATRIATVAGTNVTLSTAAAIAMSASIKAATCALTSSNWFVLATDSGNSTRVWLAESNGTNAPNLSTQSLSIGSSGSYLTAQRLTNTTAMACLQDPGSSNGIISHITANGSNSPTFGTTNTLDGTNNCTYITQSPIDSNHTLCAYNNATTSNGCLAVIQANGTNAPTAISRSTFASTAVTYCALASHSASLHSLLYTDSSSDGQHLAVSIDTNYALTWSKQSTLNGTTNCAYNAIASLTATTAIGAWQEGAGSDGKAATLTLTPTPIISGQLIGISQDTATNGTATIDLGPVFNTTNTLTLGEEYFANPAGGLTTNATTVFVGTADTTNSLVLSLGGNTSVGLEQVWEITTAGAFTWTAPESGEYEIALVGAGGSGALRSTAYHANGGNSGNAVLLHKNLAGGQALIGTLGTGAAAQTSDATDGNTGGTSSVSSPFTATATGGRGGLYIAGYNGGGAAPNPANSQDVGSLGCGCGGTAKNFSFNGGSPYIGGIVNLTDSSGVAGVRGSGGTGGTTSGAGGNGVVRITLKRGTNVR